VWTVGEVTAALRRAVEGIGNLIVEGEVTSLKVSPQGHIYFTLSDSGASVSAVMYRASVTPAMRAVLEQGARVRVSTKATVWEARGQLQLAVTRVEPAGKGAILEALERLREKLLGEGLFDAAKKRAIPSDARVVGVVTSPTGAVIHDIVKVAFARGSARLLLASAQVQGARAADDIVKALDLIQRVHEVDVVILGRGGGSAEDLAAFNDERVVRAVASCRVPVVSAVGHQVDFSLVDLAADARAATPSQAAEMCVADTRARVLLLQQVGRRLAHVIRAETSMRAAARQQLVARLPDRGLVFAAQEDALAHRRERLEVVVKKLVESERIRAAGLRERISARDPRTVVALHRARVVALRTRLSDAMRRSMFQRMTAVQASAVRLDTMSPLRVLGRGYAIALDASGRAIRTADQVAVGDRISLRVEHAEVVAVVDAVRPG
jgi:exodeoxyribonuclease VII large subunit